MPPSPLQPPGQPTPVHSGLSEIDRLMDTYIAPEKTFLDIRSNANWWLPFLFSVVISLLFTYSVDRQIGFEKVAEVNVARSASAQQRLSAIPDVDREHAMQTIATTTRIITYASPVISLIFSLIIAAILMVSFNFGLGAKVEYKRYLAVWMYASLPFVIKYILAAISIFAGASAEQFNLQNPVGTNIGWYLSSDIPLWLSTLLTSVDIFTIWVVVLLVLGCATVAKVKRSHAAMVVVGWWLLLVLGFTVSASFQG